jgi:excisionase family DNA binding protein
MEIRTVAQLYSLRDAAARLSISLRTLRRRIDLGDIEAVRIGSRIVRISEKEIQRVIRDGI